MRGRPTLRWIAIIACSAGLAGGLAACGGGDDDGGATGASTTPEQTPTGGQGSAGGGASTTGGAAAGGQSASAQVSAGEQVYSESCAACHGDQGQGGTGPALIGSGANLSTHGDGAGLLQFISENMPLSDPGSLSEQQYLDVTAYILDQDGKLGDEALTQGNAAKISLGGG